MVVFDADAIGTATPTQIGDYAAMHLLGTPSRNTNFAAVSARSILSLFAESPDVAPASLTAFDRAYLEGAYATGPQGLRGSVTRAMLDAYQRECAEEPHDCQFLTTQAEDT